MITQLKKWLKLLSPQGKKFSVYITSLTGYKPKNIATYQLALLHKSVQKKNTTGKTLSNERLEFLGDAILGAVIASELYLLFPDKDEGALTKMRSRIVNRSLLNEVGQSMKLIKHISTQTQIDISQTNILGDAVEALIGAVYVDLGYFKARKFILDKIVVPHLDIFDLSLNDSNYKSRLIEWGHKKKILVKFETKSIKIEKENGNQFVCQAFIHNTMMGEGHGASKKEAQQNAARIAYIEATTQPDFINLNNEYNG